MEKIALGRLDAEGTAALIVETLDGAPPPPDWSISSTDRQTGIPSSSVSSYARW